MSQETLNDEIETGSAQTASDNALEIGMTFERVQELEERVRKGGGVEQWVLPEGCEDRTKGQMRLVCSDKELQKELWNTEDRLYSLLNAERESKRQVGSTALVVVEQPATA